MNLHSMHGRRLAIGVAGILLVSLAASPGRTQQTASFRKFEAAERTAAYQVCPLLSRLDEWWLSDERGPDEPDPAELARCESAATAGDVRAQMAMFDYWQYRRESPSDIVSVVRTIGTF